MSLCSTTLGYRSKGLLRAGAYLAEHGDHGVEHNVGLREVGARAFDENVCRIQTDAAKMTVDHRR